MNDPKLILNQKQKLSTEINDRKPDKDWQYFNNMLQRKVQTLMNWCKKNEIDNVEVILALDNYVNGADFPLDSRIIEWATKDRHHINDIREAVDIAIGDDGNRSEEVIEILKQNKK